MGVGRVMSFRPFWGCKWCKQESAFTDVVGTKEIDSVRFTYENGICNYSWEAMESAEKYSAANGNAKVYVTYNPSYGWSLDILRSLYLMLGGVTESSQKLAQSWKRLASEVEPQANGEPGVIIHAAHSQGAQEAWAARRFFKNDAEILKNQVEVTTYGPAELISKGVFKKVDNYVSNHDAVPFIASPHRYIQAKRGRIDNVHFISSNTFAFVDHAFGGDVYRSQMEENGRKIKQRFRIE